MTPRIARFLFPWRPRRPYLAGTGRRRLTPASTERQVHPKSQPDPQPSQADFTALPGGPRDGFTAVFPRVADAPRLAPAPEPGWSARVLGVPVTAVPHHVPADLRLWCQDWTGKPDGDETPQELYADGTDMPLPPSQQPQRTRQPDSVMIPAERDPRSGSGWLHEVMERNAIAEKAAALAREARSVPVAARTWFRPHFDNGRKYESALTTYMGSVPTEQERWAAWDRATKEALNARYFKATTTHPAGHTAGSIDTGIMPVAKWERFDGSPSGRETTR